MACAARGTLRRRVRGCEQRVGHARFRSASGAFACRLSGTLIVSGCSAGAAKGSGDVRRIIPQRLIPLDGDLAEIAFALGVGDRARNQPNTPAQPAAPADTRQGTPA